MSRTRPVLRGVRCFCELYEDISASAKERIYAAAEREGDASDGEARRGRGGFASRGGTLVERGVGDQAVGHSPGGSEPRKRSTSANRKVPSRSHLPDVRVPRLT